MTGNLARKEAESSGTSAGPPGGGGDVSGDRRAGESRLVTILRIGKLIKGEAQELCLIRNISEGGLKAHVYSPHTAGDRITVEFGSDTRVSGTVRWVRDDNIGMEFDARVDVAELLKPEAAAGRKPRAPRLDIRGQARLRIGADVWRVEVRDLSQGGAKIKIDDPLHVGEDCVVTVDGLRPVKAVVRWQEDGSAGLEFLPRIPFDELIQWLGLQAEQERPAE